MVISCKTSIIDIDIDTIPWPYANFPSLLLLLYRYVYTCAYVYMWIVLVYVYIGLCTSITWAVSCIQYMNQETEQCHHHKHPLCCPFIAIPTSLLPLPHMLPLQPLGTIHLFPISINLSSQECYMNRFTQDCPPPLSIILLRFTQFVECINNSLLFIAK